MYSTYLDLRILDDFVLGFAHVFGREFGEDVLEHSPRRHASAIDQTPPTLTKLVVAKASATEPRALPRPLSP